LPNWFGHSVYLLIVWLLYDIFFIITGDKDITLILVLNIIVVSICILIVLHLLSAISPCHCSFASHIMLVDRL
jgi:hypothetical protein